MSSIREKVEAARAGRSPQLVAKMPSGWVLMGDVQPLAGYCVLIADPIVPSLNDLGEEARATYSRDMARLGDALLKVTGARRINYETWGNLDPTLHTHIVPRFHAEPEPQRGQTPREAYQWQTARPFEEERDGPLRDKIRAELAGATRAE